MRSATIEAIASYLPSRRLSNEELAALYPQWTAEKIFEKTGVLERAVAADDEFVSDMAVKAARRVLEKTDVRVDDIDLLVVCTQSPDYALPATACLVQEQLGLRTRTAAFDINQGCSSYPYGLAVVRGMIETGTATRALLITADLYTRYINPMDKSVRTLFGDASAATLVSSKDREVASLGPFVLGTDGSGAQNLVVPASGAHARRDTPPVEHTDDSGNVRSDADLYMNGPAIFEFTLRRIPELVRELLDLADLEVADVKYFVFHQANEYILRFLQRKMKIPDEQFPLRFAHFGNTVSSTIPLVLESLVSEGALASGDVVVAAGFGVGYSWGANVIRWYAD